MKLLFVCSGNTCRSPMAQGLARKYFFDKHEIFSAGISAFEGDSVSMHAVAVLREKGIDISGHTAVRLTKDHLESSDLVLTMTESQARVLIAKYPEFSNKITMLGSWAGSGKEVSDPWGGSIDHYRCCLLELEKMLKIAGDKLK